MSTFGQKPHLPKELGSLPTQLGPLPTEQGLGQWLAPLRAEYQRAETPRSDQHSADAAALGNHDASEQRARRSQHIQNLAALIRKVPEQQRVVAQRRRWTLYSAAAAAAVVAFVGSISILGLAPSNPVAQVSPSTEKASEIQASDAPKVDPVQPASAQPSPAQNSAANGGANLRQASGRVVLTHANGQPELATRDTAFVAGDEVSTTAASFASLDVGRSRVDLSSASTLKLLRVDKFDQAFRLDAGRVELSIPKVPGESRTIQVQTADTLVTVKGTIFSVEVVHEDDRLATLVQVTRGLVAVRAHGRDHLVHPGESWSSATDSITTDADESGAVVPPKPSLRKKGRAEVPSAVTASSLAEQNKLFAAGLEARDRGDDTQAKQMFDELLRRFPSSPLRSSALNERSAAARRLEAKATY